MIELMNIIVVILIAIICGKVVSKIKLPAILGWLIAGMTLGPNALNFMNEGIMESSLFHNLIQFAEVCAGLLIGVELVWSEMKKTGKQIVIVCFAEAMATCIVVALAFHVLLNVPMLISLVFGGIALATAPAPSLSIIQEYNAKGPVSKTLIPLAALDDVLGLITFFSIISVVANKLSGQSIPMYIIPLIILIPIIYGIVMGLITAKFVKKETNHQTTLITMVVAIIITVIIGNYLNQHILPKPVLNLLLVGTSFAATIANIVSKERLENIMESIKIVTGLSLVLFIFNLGAPLDYHLITSAGVTTAIYIIFRAIGKMSGAYFGGKISKMPDTVSKYLGFVLLPHSGVSLVFTSIAVDILMTAGSIEAKSYALLIQGTIAAAAVINEVVAVFLAQYGLKLSGEINIGKTENGIVKY